MYFEFAKRRAWRILPPYYTACSFAAIIALISHKQTYTFLLKWLGVHAALLQITIPGYFDQILGQVWSIALEASCYLLFPVFVEAFKRVNPRTVLVALAVLNALYRWKIAHLAGLNPDMVFPLTNNVFGRCFEFAVGMFAALCVSKWVATGVFPLRVYDLFFILPALWKVHFSLLDPLHIPRLGSTIDLAWGVIFGVVVVVSSKSFLFRKFLAVPILVWAGEISYSVYLVHAHVLLLLTYLLNYLKCTGALMAMAEILVVIPACFAVGCIFFRFFERPFLSRRSPPLMVDRPVDSVSPLGAVLSGEN